MIYPGDKIYFYGPLHRLCSVENRVVRVTFGPKGKEVAEDYGILHNELKKVYFSPDIMV
jgi:hypothetical protein